MKIFELVYPKFSDIKKSTPFDAPNLSDKKHKFRKKIDSPGFGSYAYGAIDKKDPHMFNKKNWMPVHRDSYYEYVRWIQPYIESNPFLPRVYEIKMTTDPKGARIPRYKIEKLHTYTDFSEESLLGMAIGLFPNFVPPILTGETEKESIWKAMIRQIDKMIDGKSVQTDNEHLIQAVEIIKSILSNTTALNDMHSGNAMIRGTPHGPQLVLTDPVS